MSDAGSRMRSFSPPPSTDLAGWLQLLEELFDPATIERLERIGVEPGWRVLDAGAGGGSIAAWLAARVGPSGHVLATDLDVQLLEKDSAPNLEVRRHDLAVDDLPADAFDLVHCRALLVHLDRPELAVQRLASAVRPGGTLVCEEPWVDAGLLAPDPEMARMVRGLTRRLDGGLARRLPVVLRETGLEAVHAEGALRPFDGGSRLAEFFRLALEGAAEPLVAEGELDAETVSRVSARFRDPRWCEFGWPRIAAWGRRPA